MTLIKIGETIVNMAALTSVHLQQNVLVLHLNQRQVKLPLDENTHAVYAWLVEQCEVRFDGAATEETDAGKYGLSKSAWTMLLRIERHEERTGLLGLPIDDDDMEVTIELERRSLIRTNVHEAMLTNDGRDLLAAHRASEEAGEGESQA